MAFPLKNIASLMMFPGSNWLMSAAAAGGEFRASNAVTRLWQLLRRRPLGAAKEKSVDHPLLKNKGPL